MPKFSSPRARVVKEVWEGRGGGGEQNVTQCCHLKECLSYISCTAHTSREFDIGLKRDIDTNLQNV